MVGEDALSRGLSTARGLGVAVDVSSVRVSERRNVLTFAVIHQTH